jgi:hypothetical protein
MVPDLVNREDQVHVSSRYGSYRRLTLLPYAAERHPHGATTCPAAFSHSTVSNLRLPHRYCWYSIER